MGSRGAGEPAPVTPASDPPAGKCCRIGSEFTGCGEVTCELLGRAAEFSNELKPGDPCIAEMGELWRLAVWRARDGVAALCTAAGARRGAFTAAGGCLDSLQMGCMDMSNS